MGVDRLKTIRAMSGLALALWIMPGSCAAMMLSLGAGDIATSPLAKWFYVLIGLVVVWLGSWQLVKRGEGEHSS